jgi:hypothetical protein
LQKRDNLIRKLRTSKLITKRKLIIAGICGVLLIISTFAVPQRGGSLDISDRGLKGGPGGGVNLFW